MRLNVHLKDSEEAKQIEEDDCDGHLAGEDEEGEVEGVAGDDGLVQEVHAEAADEVEGGRRNCTGLALLVQHGALLLKTSQNYCVFHTFSAFNW